MPETNHITFIGELAPPVVHLWVGYFSNFSFEIDHLRSALSEEERLRAERFFFNKDRVVYTYSHTMLRQVLSAYSGQSPQRLKFSDATTGKPLLVDCPDICFNLSHSGDIFVVGVSRSRKVGVDIEGFRIVSDLPQIAKKIMTLGEYRLFKGCDESNQIPFFYKCWVRKEAVVKAWGIGITDELNTIEVIGAESQDEFQVFLDNGDGRKTIWSGKEVMLGDRLVGAVCVEGAHITLRVMDMSPCARG